MYAMQTAALGTSALSVRADIRAIARFEAWLRSRGFEPQRDPFMPDPAEGELMDRDSGVQLVREYLEDRPAERSHWRVLLRHVLETQMTAPAWGDAACGIYMAD